LAARLNGQRCDHLAVARRVALNGDLSRGLASQPASRLRRLRLKRSEV